LNRITTDNEMTISILEKIGVLILVWTGSKTVAVSMHRTLLDHGLLEES
jgi:hypothetical protein